MKPARPGAQAAARAGHSVACRRRKRAASGMSRAQPRSALPCFSESPAACVHHVIHPVRDPAARCLQVVLLDRMDPCASTRNLEAARTAAPGRLKLVRGDILAADLVQVAARGWVCAHDTSKNERAHAPA